MFYNIFFELLGLFTEKYLLDLVEKITYLFIHINIYYTDRATFKCFK